MGNRLKLDIVSDVSCPWCVIGYKSLEQALNNLADVVKAEIHWQPFELNPNMPKEGQEIHEHLQGKYGSTPEESDKNHQMITERGANLGFQFNFQANGRIYNTFDAHRLLHWAGKTGKQTELKLALFNLYFHDGGNPSDHADLLTAVKQINLDVEEATAILKSDQYADVVREREHHYRELGISSVPTFIINEKYSIVGGHPIETFEKALRDIAQE